MTNTDIIHAAFMRLGASKQDADTLISFISTCASSPDAFAKWNATLPPPVGKSLIEGFKTPAGEAVAREIIAGFQQQLVKHFKITDDEIAKHFAAMHRD